MLVPEALASRWCQHNGSTALESKNSNVLVNSRGGRLNLNAATAAFLDKDNTSKTNPELSLYWIAIQQLPSEPLDEVSCSSVFGLIWCTFGTTTHDILRFSWTNPMWCDTTTAMERSWRRKRIRFATMNVDIHLVQELSESSESFRFAGDVRWERQLQDYLTQRFLFRMTP